MKEIFLDKEKSKSKIKKLKLFLIGGVAIIVGLSLLFVKPSQKVETVGGFLSEEKHGLKIIELGLKEDKISPEEENELRILVKNNDNVTHNVSIIIEHDPNIKIKDKNIVVNQNKATVKLPNLHQGMIMGPSIKFSGKLENFVKSVEYIINVNVISDSKEIFNKKVIVTVRK